MDTEPTQKDVAREFPGWHLWTGVAGLKYASLRKASPPVVVRADNWAAVREQLAERLAGRRA